MGWAENGTKEARGGQGKETLAGGGGRPPPTSTGGGDATTHHHPCPLTSGSEYTQNFSKGGFRHIMHDILWEACTATPD